jgi:hypothetical protein
LAIDWRDAVARIDPFAGNARPGLMAIAETMRTPAADARE